MGKKLKGLCEDVMENLQENQGNATLIERIIKYREEQCIRSSSICIEAADEILRLREEVEKWKALAENGFEFCPYCGKNLKPIRWQRLDV